MPFQLKFYADTEQQKNKYFCYKIADVGRGYEALARFQVDPRYKYRIKAAYISSTNKAFSHQINLKSSELAEYRLWVKLELFNMNLNTNKSPKKEGT